MLSVGAAAGLSGTPPRATPAEPITYLLAKLFDELLLQVCTSIVLSACAFYAIGLHGSFALFWLIYLLTLSIGIILAYFVAAIAPNMDAANAILPTCVTCSVSWRGVQLDACAA